LKMDLSSLEKVVQNLNKELAASKKENNGL
jgi:hypothetical protein